MIEVRNLVKEFPGRRAVDGISFDVRKHEILGFLGPNGAGKTTTMRILTGFMPATSGSVTVAGYDVFEHSRDARRHMGYLPENVPLYPEMRVEEYLSFRAQLKGVKRARRHREIRRAMERCGVAPRRRQVIGTLSKGFRQRVGLADAVLGEPDILILDEPTVGLDPNQIRDVRALIKELGRDHTLVLSTHILPEVEMTADRVLIIDDGVIVAQDTPENLRGSLQTSAAIQLTVRLPGSETNEDPSRGQVPAEAARQQLVKLPGVANCRVRDFGPLTHLVVGAGALDPREDIFKLAVANGWVLLEMHREALTLEEMFVKLTGDSEPDAEAAAATEADAAGATDAQEADHGR